MWFLGMQLVMPDFRNASIWGPQLVLAASPFSRGVKLAPRKHVGCSCISPWGLEGGPASPTGCVLETRHFRFSSGWTKLAAGHAHARQEVTKSCHSVRQAPRNLQPWWLKFFSFYAAWGIDDSRLMHFIFYLICSQNVFPPLWLTFFSGLLDL